MTVTARWDGDVWVEVDDALVLETRRWIEGDFLVVARTTTLADGRLVTSRAFMGKPRRKAPRRRGASRGDRSRRRERARRRRRKRPRRSARRRFSRTRTPSRTPAPEAESVYSPVEKAVETVASTVRCTARSSAAPPPSSRANRKPQSPRTRRRRCPRAGRPVDRIERRARFSGGTPFDSVLRILPVHPRVRARPPVHLRVPRPQGRAQPLPRSHTMERPREASSSATSRLRRLLLSSSVSPRDSTSNWTAPATGTPRTSAWCMLGEADPSPGEEVLPRRERRAAPLRVGFEPERYVFVHVVQAGSLPELRRGPSSSPRRRSGRYGAAVTSRDPPSRARPPGSDARSRSRRLRARISRRTAWWWRWRAAGSGRMATAKASTLGEAQLPLAMLPRDRAGAEEVKESPFTVRLSTPRETRRSVRGRGDAGRDPRRGRIGRTGAAAAARAAAGDARGFSVVAWVGTVRSVRAGRDRHPRRTEFGRRFDSRGASRPTRGVPVTINVHKVRGVVAKAGLSTVDEDAELGKRGDGSQSDLRCRLKIGDQMATTTPAPHTPKNRRRGVLPRDSSSRWNLGAR